MIGKVVAKYGGGYDPNKPQGGRCFAGLCRNNAKHLCTICQRYFCDRCYKAHCKRKHYQEA